MKEFINIVLVMDKIKFHKHQWVIRVDLKIVNFIFGERESHIKYICFLYPWDNNKDNEEKKNALQQGEYGCWRKYVIHEPLIERDQIILPPLLIKLGLLKQSMKALH